MTPPIRGKTWHLPRLIESGRDGIGTAVWSTNDGPQWTASHRRDFEARCEQKRIEWAKSGKYLQMLKAGKVVFG